MTTIADVSPLTRFTDLVESRDAVIGVLGLGYVGIPLAISIAGQGMRVLGFDILQKRIDQLNSGHSPIKHFSDEDITRILQAGFEATQDFSRMAECDAIIICVPTPLDKSREPDLGFVISTMKSISPHLRAGQLLSLESTTWPGTTSEVLLPYVEDAGLTVGENFFLAYSPEREDPGNAHFSTQTIPKVVGGRTKNCLIAGQALYGAFIDKIVPVSFT